MFILRNSCIHRNYKRHWDSVGSVGLPNQTPGQPIVKNNVLKDAVEALISLGYSPPEASRMVNAVDATDLSSEKIIRAALQAMVK